jgi:hypothetical protein
MEEDEITRSPRYDQDECHRQVFVVVNYPLLSSIHRCQVSLLSVILRCQVSAVVEHLQPSSPEEDAASHCRRHPSFAYDRRESSRVEVEEDLMTDSKRFPPVVARPLCTVRPYVIDRIGDDQQKDIGRCRRDGFCPDVVGTRFVPSRSYAEQAGTPSEISGNDNA